MSLRKGNTATVGTVNETAKFVRWEDGALTIELHANGLAVEVTLRLTPKQLRDLEFLFSKEGATH